MIKRQHFLTLITLLLISSAASAVSEDYVKLKTRPGVVQELLVIKAKNPQAAVILLPGGAGIVDLSYDGPGKTGNFLVRSRRDFAANGLMVVLMDAASDWKKRKKGLKGKRLTDEHAQDIAAVIKWVRERVQVPVWLVGTSRGTISAVHAAASLDKDKGPDGLVLTASVTEPGNKGRPTVFDARLEQITQPVLLVHHEKDACKVSPPEGAERLRQALTGAGKTELLTFSDGKAKSGKECKGYSWHGFLGIERKVIDAISKWLTTQ